MREIRVEVDAKEVRGSWRDENTDGCEDREDFPGKTRTDEHGID